MMNQHWRKTWTKSEQRRWPERIEFLLDALSLDKPVQVRRVPMKRAFGDCEDLGPCYRVRICNTLEYQTAVLILLHELAHALEPHGEDHSPAFWHASGLVWAADDSYDNDREYEGDV